MSASRSQTVRIVTQVGMQFIEIGHLTKEWLALFTIDDEASSDRIPRMVMVSTVPISVSVAPPVRSARARKPIG